MGYTITEKILARVAGLPAVKAGDEIMAKPDYVIAYDFPGYTDVYFKQMKEEFGIDRVAEPDRYAIFIDHMIPAASPKEEELHIGTRKWCAENNVPLFERKGIGHQVACEVGYATPGAFVVHFDGHVSQLGTFGTLAMGIRRNILEAFVRERISMKVPHTVRVNLRGALQKGVMARDVFHQLVRVMGPSSCRFQVLEIGGPAVSTLSTEGLQTITGLAMFTGAVTAIVNPEGERLQYALSRARKKLDPVTSDPDATYAAVHDIDLTDLEPVIVIPPTPSNTRNLTDFLGIEIHAGYLGSCASGRIEDMRAAANVLRGPAGEAGLRAQRRADQQRADGGGREGRPDQHPGRSGRVHLVAELRLLLRPHRHHDGEPARGFDRHAEREGPHGQPGLRNLPVQRRGGRRSRDRRQDRRSTPVPVMSNALPNLRGRVAFIFEERDFDVDQIIGVKNIKIQDVDELAALAMQSYDPEFQSKVRKGDVVVGADNFGYGHPHYPPMRAMRHLGIAGVIAESFSPGYWRGEISMGFPQVSCPGILGFVERWDDIEVDWTAGVVRNLTRTKEIAFEPLSRADRQMLEAGGLVPYLKQSSVA